MEVKGSSPRVPVWAAALAAAALVAVGAGEALAQSGSVRGRIVDESGQPLEGVKVQIRQIVRPPRIPQRLETKTDASGGFSAVGLPTGRYRLTYTKEGYEKVVQETNIPDGVADMGVVTLTKLPEGVLSEEQHAEAQKLIKEFDEASAKGDYDKAIETMRRFLELVPNSPEAYFNMAVTYEKAGDTDKALENYQKAAELRPTFYEAHVAIADIYGKRKEWAKAQATLQKALEIKKETYVLFNLGAYATNAGDLATARKAFEEVIQLEPTNAVAHYQLGMLSLSEQKTDEAIEYLEKYLELDPEGPYAESAKQVIEQLKAASQQG